MTPEKPPVPEARREEAGSSPEASAAAALRFRPAVEKDIPLIRSLAERIWKTCFPAFLSQEQIDYMLGWMYAPEVLRREMGEGILWEIVEIGDRPAGYISCTVESPDRMKLNKLYLLPELHGRGIGLRMIDHVRASARSRGIRQIYLQVNRANRPALRAYQRAGFRIVRTAVTDIGGGFVMDDHFMALDV